MRGFIAWCGIAAVLLCACSVACAAEQHPARGVVTRIEPAKHSMVVSCEAIPGYMSAMEMEFTVRDDNVLHTITPGTTVRFTLVPRDHVLYAENVQAASAANFEPEPMQAGGMTALEHALNPASAIAVVKQGEAVPEFVLTDQAGRAIHLSQLRGKVVLLTFGYSRCPNPDYCVRLSNNLALVEKRFSAHAGRELVLVTIAIDPEHDRGEALREYAAVWHANPADWHFLTGSLPDVQHVSAMFGMNFWRDEGLLTHSLHTAILDRQGRLAANLEGNQFTPQQLGDLVQTVMDRPQ
jgi:protein SCO1